MPVVCTHMPFHVCQLAMLSISTRVRGAAPAGACGPPSQPRERGTPESTPTRGPSQEERAPR